MNQPLKELYLAEFQTWSKHANEGWAAFAGGLKVLADKAFPQLPNDAKVQIALNHYLIQLTDNQIVFNVQQKHPHTLEEAVSVTLDFESYLMLSSLLSTHAPVSKLPTPQVVTGVHESQETMLRILIKMMERLDKLESEQAMSHSCNGTHQSRNVH